MNLVRTRQLGRYTTGLNEGSWLRVTTMGEKNLVLKKQVK